MEYLSYEEVIAIHNAVIAQHGGSAGLRDYGALASSVDQPLASFGDFEAFPTVVEKAAALCYYLVENHPFVDGNKRVGHASMEVLLRKNGYLVNAPVDEQEMIVLNVASGTLSREAFVNWVIDHIEPHA